MKDIHKEKIYLSTCKECNKIFTTINKKEDVCNRCKLKIKKTKNAMYFRFCKKCDKIFPTPYKKGSLCSNCAIKKGVNQKMFNMKIK